MHEDILDDVEQKGATFVMVKDRELIPAYDDTMRLNVYIDGLTTCENPFAQGVKTANFDALCNKLVSFGSIKIGENRTLSICLEEKLKKPVLGTDLNISLASSIYSLPLGSKKGDSKPVWYTFILDHRTDNTEKVYGMEISIY